MSIKYFTDILIPIAMCIDLYYCQLDSGISILCNTLDTLSYISIQCMFCICIILSYQTAWNRHLHWFRTVHWLRQSLSIFQHFFDLLGFETFERHSSLGVDLPEGHSIWPHIWLLGVHSGFLVFSFKCLKGHPSDWDLCLELVKRIILMNIILRSIG